MLKIWRRHVHLTLLIIKWGQRIQFPMTTGRKVEEQPFIFRGKKRFTAENVNTYRCLVFSLVEYKKGKEKGGDYLLYYRR
jgi:hypothetical protein